MTGEQFREWRKEHDIAAKEVAAEIGVCTEHLWRIERGDANAGGAVQVSLDRYMSDHKKVDKK